MKSTKVQTSPISRSRALRHLHNQQTHVQSLGSKYVMATLAQFVKLNSIVGMRQCSIIPNTYVPTYMYMYLGLEGMPNGLIG